MQYRNYLPVTTMSDLPAANANYITIESTRGTHADSVPFGSADVNYTCLVFDTNSKPDNINTDHQATATVNTDEVNCYDLTSTQSATYNSNVGLFANNDIMESSSYDNNVHRQSSCDHNAGPKSVVEQRETVCKLYNSLLM